MIRLLALSLILSSTVAVSQPVSPALSDKRPSLVVLIVIDQFRSDYLTRFPDRFLPAKNKKGMLGGFKYLMTQGAYFPLAEYKVLQAMTAVGHSAISTGTYPYRNGIALNGWFNQDKQQRVYCVDDTRYKVLGPETKSLYLGTSPRALMGPTLGDAMKNAGLSSTVVSISIKNRASIFMGGHRPDAAVWFDSNQFAWTSSTFYFPGGKLPEWVQALNKSVTPQKSKKDTWVSQGPGSGVSDHGGNSFSRDHIGRQKMSGPFGVQITLDAVKGALKAYNLGHNKHTDLLMVSFSGHDFLGHQVGPNTREMEEMTLLEDTALSQLINHVNKHTKNGLKDVVFVLTGDHGIPPMPEYLKTRRIPTGRINSDTLKTELNMRLNTRFGKPNKGVWVPYITNLNIYLNHPAIAAAKLKHADVEDEVKAYARTVEGVVQVFSRTDHKLNQLPAGRFGTHAMNSYFPGRSGDVVLVPRAFYIKGRNKKGKYSVSHLSGYTYDRMVPLIISGPSIRGGMYASAAEVIDIAPTLSFIMGIVPPALSEGRVLHEIFVPAKK